MSFHKKNKKMCSVVCCSIRAIPFRSDNIYRTSQQSVSHFQVDVACLVKPKLESNLSIKYDIAIFFLQKLAMDELGFSRKFVKL